jgi:hypothetical protein
MSATGKVEATTGHSMRVCEQQARSSEVRGLICAFAAATVAIEGLFVRYVLNA